MALEAVLGHVFTCFHGFKGGKAVATSLGAVLALAPAVGGCAFALWLLAWLLGWSIFGQARSAAVGPASMLAAPAAPALHILLLGADPWGADLPVSIILLLLALVILVRHRSNLALLLGRPHTSSEAPS